MIKSYPIFGNGSSSELYNPDELLNLFLNCTADGFAIVDMENRFIRINHIYTKIFGFTEEDVIGKKFEEFSTPEIVIELVELAKKGKVFTNFITQRNHKNGTPLIIAASYSPFRNLKGEIIAVIAIFRDITESRKMEQELKKTRELYKLITENTTDMILVFSKDKKIIYASPSHEKVIGFSPEQLIGRHLYDLMLPGEGENFQRLFQKQLDSGEPQLIEEKLRTADNSFIYVESNVSPIYNEQMEIEAFVTVGRNITDRIKNEEVLRNLDRLSIIGQLAAGVAHEIRNPLTSLKGFSKLLQRVSSQEEQEEYLAIIMTELDRIDMIVNEFMSLAKPQATQFEQKNLMSILDSTINILHPLAILHNVQIVSKIPNEEIALLCNPHQLKQVFVNILKNAIESMPNGGKVQITVQKIENERVLISFSDEGLGIESGLLEFLGTPFYTTKDKGIGLGLTISNKIIQEHNGSMQIKSEVEKGTIVKVELGYI